jgi:hypothetical protein
MEEQKFRPWTDADNEIMERYSQAAQNLLGVNIIGGTAFAFLRGMNSEPDLKGLRETLAAFLSEAAFYLPVVRRAIEENWADSGLDERGQLMMFSRGIAQALEADLPRVYAIIKDHFAAVTEGMREGAL